MVLSVSDITLPLTLQPQTIVHYKTSDFIVTSKSASKIELLVPKTAKPSTPSKQLMYNSRRSEVQAKPIILDCEDMFPGLVLTMEAIFRLPAWALEK
jgi:hypothetical protein